MEIDETMFYVQVVKSFQPLAMVYTMPSFKLKFSLGFITSSYVIFSLSMVQAMDKSMIT